MAEGEKNQFNKHFMTAANPKSLNMVRVLIEKDKAMQLLMLVVNMPAVTSSLGEVFLVS